ncbi:hypothetical protein HOD20_06515 [archaeon]|jgi:hypothetical protein|nr:hypothetical protein [archaeon]MBT4352156.1 hypothetical protein [archaeon]MBT4648280.1 hypothetical protein [archaeon]MBT6821532.1 hypothetical protein [archaeon]MBT7391931.1 hypothetical protein [archaeon]
MKKSTIGKILIILFVLLISLLLMGCDEEVINNPAETPTDTSCSNSNIEISSIVEDIQESINIFEKFDY